MVSLDKESRPTKYDNKDHFDAFRLSNTFIVLRAYFNVWIYICKQTPAEMYVQTYTEQCSKPVFGFLSCL